MMNGVMISPDLGPIVRRRSYRSSARNTAWMFSALGLDSLNDVPAYAMGGGRFAYLLADTIRVRCDVDLLGPLYTSLLVAALRIRSGIAHTTSASYVSLLTKRSIPDALVLRGRLESTIIETARRNFSCMPRSRS